MRGSEKQIAWAEKIRTEINMKNAFGDQKLTPGAKKAIDFIDSIEDARFWIDHRENKAQALLMELARGTLQVKGSEFSHVAKIAENDEITVAWNEIVNDNKGGHREEKTEIF